MIYIDVVRNINQKRESYWTKMMAENYVFFSKEKIIGILKI